MGLRRDVAGRAIDGALADECSSEANERWLSGNGPTTVNFHGSSDEGSTRREDGGFGRTDLRGRLLTVAEQKCTRDYSATGIETDGQK